MQEFENVENSLGALHQQIIEAVGRPISEVNFPLYSSALFDGRNATAEEPKRVKLSELGLESPKYHGLKGISDEFVWVSAVLPQSPSQPVYLPAEKGHKLVQPPQTEDGSTVYVQVSVMTRDNQGELVERVFVLFPKGEERVYDHLSFWVSEESGGAKAGRPIKEARLSEEKVPDGFWQKALLAVKKPKS